MGKYEEWMNLFKKGGAAAKESGGERGGQRIRGED
jgi:hypothetical protein